MDDANDFVALHAVLTHGGFSTAARRLGLPKGTLSKRVARLEERLGVRLLERSARNVRATEVGRQVFEQTQHIVAGLGAAAAVAASAQAEPSGGLRVGSPQGLIHGMLAEILPAFLQAYPRISLHLEELNRPADLIRDRIDLALSARIEVEADAHLVVRRLARESGVLAAAPGFVAGLAAPLQFEDLGRLPSLTMSHETTWNLVDRSGARRQIELAPRLVSPNLEMLRAAAEAGLGIGLLPEHICRAGFLSGKLSPVLPEWSTAEGTIYAVFSSRRGVTPAMRALIDYLAETIPLTTSSLDPHA